MNPAQNLMRDPQHEANIESGGGLACSWPTATGSSSTWTSSSQQRSWAWGFIMAAVVGVALRHKLARAKTWPAVKRAAGVL